MRTYRRYHYFPVPDNAFTRTVARVGAVCTIVAVAAFGLACAIFALGAFLGLSAALLGIDL